MNLEETTNMRPASSELFTRKYFLPKLGEKISEMPGLIYYTIKHGFMEPMDDSETPYHDLGGDRIYLPTGDLIVDYGTSSPLH